MATWSYRKRVTIAPGVRLNIIKKGISTTFGVRDVGKKGVYLNAGIPGTGIYKRQKIGGKITSNVSENNYIIPDGPKTNKFGFISIFFLIGIIVGVCFLRNDTINAILNNFDVSIAPDESWALKFLGIFIIFCCVMGFGTLGNLIIKMIANSSSAKAKRDEEMYQTLLEPIYSAIIQTTDPIKKEILQNYLACLKLNKKSDEIEEIINALKVKISKKNKPELEVQLKKQEKELSKLTEDFNSMQFDIDKSLNEKEKKAYSHLCEKFEELLSSEKIWIITSSKQSTELKSSAGISITRKEISLDVGIFNYIKSEFDIPILRGNDNAMYYIYPKYIIKAFSSSKFDVFPIENVKIKYHKSRFIENETVPSDSVILEYTYQYVNKNGGPDKRYAYNPQLPVVAYGEIEIASFDLTFQISNAEATENFVNAFKVLQGNSSISDISASPKNTSRIFIDETYFNTINQVVDNLISFREGLKTDMNFLNIVNNANRLDFTINGNPNPDVAEKINFLFLYDIVSCYSELGHPIDLKSKEGLGLLIFASQYKKREQIIHYNILEKIVMENIVILQPFEELINQVNPIKTVVESSGALEEIFFISSFLGKYDINLQKKYLVLLYRFASITAKADNSITEHEEKWLSKLLQLGKESKNDEFPQNKEQAIESSGKDKSQKIFQPLTNNSHDKLHELIGLGLVKSEIESLENFIKIQQAREAKGLKSSQLSYHCVFTGNPGTGKTTVARIIAEIYKELGILKTGHLVETDRSGLVGEYVGQTAVKTNKIVDSALDGVLFIDEAYSLIAGGNADYGKEAIATLLKRMEDNRDRLVVILAGYTNEMKEFIDSNQGLQSRFSRYIEFPDYSANELFQIFEMNLKKFDYNITGNVDEILKEFFLQSVATKDRNFGNARFVRNFFEKTLERQANRLAKETNLTTEKLTEICVDDLT